MILQFKQPSRDSQIDYRFFCSTPEGAVTYQDQDHGVHYHSTWFQDPRLKLIYMENQNE